MERGARWNPKATTDTNEVMAEPTDAELWRRAAEGEHPAFGRSDAHGYQSWTIEVAGDGFTAERPCAEPGIDDGRKAVLLVPGSR
jgi:hypothetical protein